MLLIDGMLTQQPNGEDMSASLQNCQCKVDDIHIKAGDTKARLLKAMLHLPVRKITRSPRERLDNLLILSQHTYTASTHLCLNPCRLQIESCPSVFLAINGLLLHFSCFIDQLDCVHFHFVVEGNTSLFQP